jgi:signal transduction histidine kinase
VQTELSPDLPPISTDRIQLQRVVLNLILNSKDAMSCEGWRPRELLTSSRTTKSGEVLVSVMDTGPALDPRDIERVIDAFLTTKSEGMGLGLSISRTIVESNGGRLWATPTSGSGATFQFTVPQGIEGGS